MNIFLCDIVGTFESDIENREELLIKFFTNLNELVKNLNIDNIVFSFLSTDDMDLMMSYIDEIKPFISSTIIEGIHYGYKEKYENGIVADILEEGKANQVEFIIKNFSPSRIILADDNEINQSLIDLVVSKNSKSTDFISLIPGGCNGSINSFTSSKKGLEGLIECLENYNINLRNSAKVEVKI